MMHQIDEQAFYMGSIVVLISHQHDGTIAQFTNAAVFGLHVEANDP